MAIAEKRSRHLIKRGIRILCLSLLLFIILIPLWWAITMSFDGKAITSIPPFAWWPHDFSLKSYTYAFTTINLMQMYKNTLLISAVNTLISVFFAMCCGYAFSKGRFIGKRFWYYFMLCVMMIPFESRMIPLFLQYKSWGLLDTYVPLILGNFAYVFGIIFAKANINALPDALRESASIDGASEWRIFLSLILPLSKPVISALCILQFVAQWNSYLWPLIVIRSRSKQLLSVGIAMFNASETDVYFGPRMVAALVSAIPLILVYLTLQKYIVESVAMTGIKQ